MDTPEKAQIGSPISKFEVSPLSPCYDFVNLGLNWFRASTGEGFSVLFLVRILLNLAVFMGFDLR